MTPSQKRVLNWYKEHGTLLDKIKTKTKLPNGIIRIETKTHTYELSKWGGLKITKIK